MAYDGKTRGNGMGWGGPPKGASVHGGAKGGGYSPAGTPGHGKKSAIRAEKVEKFLAILEDIACSPSTPPMIRVHAADKSLDRLIGKPLQTTVNVNADDISNLDDTALSAELSRLRRERGNDFTGDASAEVPDEPRDLLH